MEYLFNLLVSVMAGIMLFYIRKLLDRNNKKDS